MQGIQNARAAVVTLAVLLAAAFPITEASDSSPPDPAVATSALRQSFDLQVPMAPTSVAVAGTQQLVYELHLTNFSSAPLVLKRVEILDARSEVVIAELNDSALGQRLDRPHAPSAAGPRTIAPGMRGVLYLEIALDDDFLPPALEHRITFHDVEQDTQRPFVVRGARVTVKTASPVLLGPPLRGGPWAAVYDPAWERGHRRVVYTFEGRARIPDRFAIDWVKLDANGRRARRDDDLVANWYGYGTDVLAVADAVVAATRGDIPESATLSGRLRYRFQDGTGNYVVLNLEDDRYAFYKHLKPGSIRVKAGERVQRGQVVGAVGFSGHASGPQLHFHVADANSPLGAAEGLPFVFTSFDLLGTYDDFDALGKAPWTALDNAMAARRTKERPAPNAVVDFGGKAR
jgi:murein DD-endopeptidase MepM/ murein hydrolase activator NlpD